MSYRCYVSLSNFPAVTPLKSSLFSESVLFLSYPQQLAALCSLSDRMWETHCWCRKLPTSTALLFCGKHFQPCWFNSSVDNRWIEYCVVWAENRSIHWWLGPFILNCIFHADYWWRYRCHMTCVIHLFLEINVNDLLMIWTLKGGVQFTLSSCGCPQWTGWPLSISSAGSVPHSTFPSVLELDHKYFLVFVQKNCKSLRTNASAKWK